MQKTGSFRKKAVIATETITTLGILIALCIVCGMVLTVRVGTYLKFSPVFIVLILAAKRYGAVSAGLVALAADVLQFLMFPTGLPFSFGICLSGVVNGFMLGLFLAKKTTGFRLIFGTISSQLVCSLGITTFVMVYIEKWYPLFPLFYWRILQVVIMSLA